MMLARTALALWLAFGPGQAPGDTDALTAAKSLYASGAYEEALTKLSDIRGSDEADQYRALCLLALGRTAETERSLEQLIQRRPLFTMSEADVSPRLVTMFHDVRRRVLPAAARALYGKAKASFDQKDFKAASAQMKDLLTLLDDEDVNAEAAALSDLKLLAEGFLKLSESELAAAAAKPAAPQPAPVAAAQSTPRSPAEAIIYSIADEDVTPPVDVVRNMPPWRPANALLAAREYRGILRIVIDEHGHLESAALLDSVAPGYDDLLIAETRRWLFKPATKNGVGVKYQRDIPIVLSPR